MSINLIYIKFLIKICELINLTINLYNKYIYIYIVVKHIYIWLTFFELNGEFYPTIFCMANFFRISRLSNSNMNTNNATPSQSVEQLGPS
jgi:hypothetical protein